MNKLIIAFTVIFMSTGAYAQKHKSLKEIDKELQQTKSTTTALALIESIGETTPETDEDVAALGQLMDKYPTQGQKALAEGTWENCVNLRFIHYPEFQTSTQISA